MLTPRRIILIGFFLVLTGAVLPFLIVLQIIPSTFFLNFLAFTTSVSGLFLGLAGAGMYMSEQRHPRDRDK
jgi:energy-coupling factor transporter transmembrane protein EcfT